MQLGFVSAILEELSLEQVFEFAAESGFDCVEVMCWPASSSDARRYAGTTHIDVVSLNQARVREIHALCDRTGVAISALGYYPNPLSSDAEERQIYIDHIRAMIGAAEMLGLSTVNTFVGRDPARSVDDNWPLFREVWPPIIRYAVECGIKVGIENCPMLFTGDEWPGGKNLAASPAVWRRMFRDIPDDNFGLNYDPSHLIWQQMDEVAPIREFAHRFHHVHAKDARLDRHRLDDVGILDVPLAYHTPKLPGLGSVRWGEFFAELSNAGYTGPVCIELEDRAYEVDLDTVKAGLKQAARYLRQYMA
ncbi:MAG: sugar phosphate isomerase/epimerase [Chloroflexota bacterium]